VTDGCKKQIIVSIFLAFFFGSRISGAVLCYKRVYQKRRG